MKLPNHTALKEWSSVIDALGSGQQVILLRKGGIADPKFGVEADRFYLYPTFFHQPEAHAEPDTVDITHWCEVARTWRIRDLDTLSSLAPFVAMSRSAIEARYRFRPDQALHVIGVRTYALPSASTIRVTPEYLGCRSWVSLDDEIDVEESTAVLSDDALEAKLDRIAAAAEPAPRSSFRFVP